MNKKWLFSIVYFFCTLLTLLLFHSYLSSEHNEVIAYSDFKRLVHEHKVLNVVINDRTVTVNVDMTGIELTTSTQEGRPGCIVALATESLPLSGSMILT